MKNIVELYNGLSEPAKEALHTAQEIYGVNQSKLAAALGGLAIYRSRSHRRLNKASLESDHKIDELPLDGDNFLGSAN